MNATKALAITLSKPNGFMLMFRYDDAMNETSRAMDALDQLYGKRPSKARERACERLAMAEGKVLALREALACMVVDASGYRVTRHQAVRAISDEQDAMAESCWLAPAGKVRMMALVTELCSILNN
jgi:hypothetical protein